MTGETWKAIPEFPDYEVSNLGRVRSHKYSGKPGMVSETPRCILRPGREKNGRASVNLRADGRQKHIRISVLVAAAFLGPRPDGMLVCHRNDDTTNDTLPNLYYGTYADNVRDAKRNECYQFSRATVQHIREESQQGASYASLARKYAVQESVIGNICHGYTYSSYPGPISTEPKITRCLSIGDIKSIRSRLNEGESGSSIARALNVSPSLISRIKNGTRYRDIA